MDVKRLYRPSRRICQQCQVRRWYSALPAKPSPSGAAKLINRRLIALSGRDAAHFLQGLTTNNVRPGQKTGLYSAFLNAQGRMLCDVFIYPTIHSSLVPNGSADDPSYLIEVDAGEAPKLVAHIKRHKLRAKLALQLLEPGELDVWSVWSEHEKWTPHASPSSNSPPPGEKEGTIGCVDPRAPGMGRRMILPGGLLPDGIEEETTLGGYTVRRILKGVAEGQSEIIRESSLPQESNLDYMGGVDFRKGCYVGQELTIRTHHTGVVRKRILPVQLYDSSGQPQTLEYDDESNLALPPSGVNISKVTGRGRSAGKWLSGVGNIGLALCRLEMMTDIVLTSEGSQWTPQQEFCVTSDDGKMLKLKAFVPDWHRNRTPPRNMKDMKEP